MQMLGSVAVGASGTAMMPTIVPNSQSMLVDGGRCSQRESRNRLIPQFGRVANPQKLKKSVKNVTKKSLQPCQYEELADSLANVGFLDIDCIGHHLLASATFLPSGTNFFQLIL
jgi:hypothetical protein